MRPCLEGSHSTRLRTHVPAATRGGAAGVPLLPAPAFLSLICHHLFAGLWGQRAGRSPSPGCHYPAKFRVQNNDPGRQTPHRGIARYKTLIRPQFRPALSAHSGGNRPPQRGAEGVRFPLAGPAPSSSPGHGGGPALHPVPSAPHPTFPSLPLPGPSPPRLIPASPSPQLLPASPRTSELNSGTKTPIGTSLVAQWLRISLPMQGTWVRSLVQEDPTCRGATKPVRHNY